MQYDTSNVFAKILRGEIPADRIYEDQYVLAFKDISPAKKHHLLVIPKGAYTSFDDFMDRASPEEVQGFFKGVHHVAHLYNMHDEGYRLIANHGRYGGQEVPHFHMHILGGEDVGPLVQRVK